MKTHGELKLVGRKWKIDLAKAPHVAVRLRRLFERIDKAEQGFLTLTATPETTRELVWFMQRYPLVVDEGTKVKIDALVLDHKRREVVVDKIITGAYVPPLVKAAIPLRPYQEVAVGMVLATGQLLLVDDVGLGKTACGIGVALDPRARPAIIVTKTDLPLQWAKEFGRFAPDLKVHIIKQGQPYDLTKGPYDRRLRDYTRVPFPDIVILNYHKLDGWAHTMSQWARSIIFDEVQDLRIPTSAKYRSARSICEAVDFRLGLSATPIYNFGGEMFHVINMIAPDSLGTVAEFAREWCGGEESLNSKPKISDPDAFGVYLRDQGLVLRRRREDVGIDLPPLEKSVQFCESTTDALEAVGDRAAELARVILAQTGYSPQQKMKASAELSWRLRQATGIGKAPFVAAFVRMIVESGERVMLYGWHKSVYAIWAELFKDLEWTKPGDAEPSKVQPCWFTGDETGPEKEKSKQDFISGESPLIIMSLRAGAGIDGLQKVCRVVVFGELDWSPGVHEQCIGRLYRPGQKEPIIAYFLVSEEGSDPVVLDTIGLKKAQSDAVRDPGADLIEGLDVESGHIKRLAEAYLLQRGMPPQRTREHA